MLRILISDLETEKNRGKICARLTNSISVCGRGSTPPAPP